MKILSFLLLLLIVGAQTQGCKCNREEETSADKITTDDKSATEAQEPPALSKAGWESVAKALPPATDGWTFEGEVVGSKFQKGKATVLKAKRAMRRGSITGSVTIADDVQAATGTTIGISLAPAMSSEREQIEKVSVGEHPGMKTYVPKKKSTTILIVVKKRFVVTVIVKGAGDTSMGMSLANRVDYTHLLSLI